MQTTITKLISPNIMVQLFDLPETVNIRLFHPVDESIQITDLSKPIKYRITIRHNEGENALQIVNNTIKILKCG